jgi:hypothetical protein
MSWSHWEGPAEIDLLEIVNRITKYIKFIDPKIIEALTIENDKRIDYFKNILLKQGVHPEHYIWPHSAFTFPGIRRHIGREEISSYKHKTLSKEDVLHKNAIYIDDNDYPKHLWSFLMTGKRFSKKGPSQYQLAHIFDHKEDNNRLQVEWNIEEQIQLPGLFTVATNVCYIPSDFIKPTDFNVNMRKMIAGKAWELYHNVANLLPDNIKVDFKDIEDSWKLDNFEWGEPVGDINNLRPFLEFRDQRIIEIINHIEEAN